MELPTKKYLFACMFGNVCEWYDFVIYGSMAPIMAKLFFPHNDKFTSFLMVFMVFAAGFIVRPIGGFLIGRLADKNGRSKMFVISLILMGGSVFLTSILPTYNTIGKLAPMLLFLLRIMQGFAIGGEYPVMTTYLSEMADKDKRGFYGSLISLSLTFGVLLASLTVALVTYGLGQASMESWGWRIPFFISFFIIIIAYFIRKKLPETKIFTNQNQPSNAKIIELLKKEKYSILNVFLFTICVAIAYYLFSIFSTTYIHLSTHVSYLASLFLTNIGIIVLIFATPLAGILSDKYGRKKIVGLGNFLFIILSLPIYYLISSQTYGNIILAQSIFAILIALILGSLPAVLAEQFPTEIRVTGIAIGYNLCVVIFGGTGPMVCMYLLKIFHSSLAPGIYLFIAATISFIASLFIKDMTRASLHIQK